MLITEFNYTSLIQTQFFSDSVSWLIKLHFYIFVYFGNSLHLWSISALEVGSLCWLEGVVGLPWLGELSWRLLGWRQIFSDALLIICRRTRLSHHCPLLVPALDITEHISSKECRHDAQEGQRHFGVGESWTSGSDPVLCVDIIIGMELVRKPSAQVNKLQKPANHSTVVPKFLFSLG